MARFFLTTAIDYANGDPHLGHALEKIGADAIARYRRLAGDDVHFLMGMDEHGQKVKQAADEEGVSPQTFVDRVAETFEEAWRKLGVSNDQFIRTTEPGHKRGVKALIERIHEKNPDDFYEKTYDGWYCVGCELFKRDNEIVKGRCVLHPTRELQWTEERNWFFRLTKYQSFLERLFDERPDFLRPEARRNEILALLTQGLEDISITRSRLTWAIPFPLRSSNGEEQGTWVWFDALPNYLTATGFPDKQYRDLWPAQLHIIGKDITRLHCVVWPAMLQAAEIAIPEHVWAHGFMTFGGERFSKSAGVAFSLDQAIDRHGPDALRYFLLREIPFDGDGDFSWERFDERYNAELANAWGNLASRVIAMVEKYRESVVPHGERTTLDRADLADIAEYHAALDGSRGYFLQEGVKRALASVTRGNEFVQSSQPWALAKHESKSAALDDVLASVIRGLARQCVLLHPFVPGKTEELWRQLGAPGRVSDQRFDGLAGLDVAGWKVRKGTSLFPRDETGAPNAGAKK